MAKKNMGVIVPLPTSHGMRCPALGPMHEHIKWLSCMHVSGVWILGTTGDFVHQSFADKKDILISLVPYTKARGLKTYSGVWDTDDYRIGELTKCAASVGADAVFAMTPIFSTVRDDEMYAYYARIAEYAGKCNMPLYLYNFPKHSSNQISGRALLLLLTDYPNVIKGIKDSSGDMKRIAELVRLSRGRDFTVLAGTNAKIIEARQVGAHGVVSSIANISPELVYQVWEYREEDKQELVAKEAEIIAEYGGPTAIIVWLQRWGLAGQISFPRFSMNTKRREAFFQKMSAICN